MPGRAAPFGYHSGSLQHGVEQATAARRMASLLVAGAFGGVAWYLLRRYTSGESSEIDEALWNGDGRLSFRRCLGTSVISEVVIGMGASIGREAAPKLLGGASASAGLALVLELTHSGFALMVPMMVATAIATVLAFHIDGYSIYSARLPADDAPARAKRQPTTSESRSDPHPPHEQK